MTQPQAIGSVSMDRLLERRWARLVTPSLSDLFFLAILTWVFAAGPFGWKGLLADGDVGWHIRTGQYILSHHAVPRHDLYSFSKPGAPWYAWEWLTDVIDASLFNWAGLKGVVLAAAVVLAVFATTLIRRMMWRGSHLMIAMVVALLGVGSSSIHFLARPHVFTLLLISISMWIIEADRKNPSRRLWLLIPITIVWTNLHGGFLALIAAAGLTAIGSAIERRPKQVLRYAELTAGCAAASLVNPYGYQLHVHIWAYLRSDWIRSVIQEFQSPSFRTESMMQFEALLFVGLIAVGALFRKKQIAEGLWILFFAYMSLSSVRHVAVYVAACAPVIAGTISDWYRGWTAHSAKSSLPGILNQIAADSAPAFSRSSMWPAVAIFALATIGRPIQWPADFPEEIFPVKMVHDHAAEIFGARVLTSDQWADYLIFKNASQKVFVDGRSDFYGPEVGNDYIHLMSAQADWRKLLEKYRFDSVLLPVDVPLVEILKLRPEWRVVEEDGKQILFVNRG